MDFEPIRTTLLILLLNCYKTALLPELITIFIIFTSEC